MFRTKEPPIAGAVEHSSDPFTPAKIIPPELDAGRAPRLALGFTLWCLFSICFFGPLGPT